MSDMIIEAMDTAPTISMREAKDLLLQAQATAFDLVCALRTFEETHGWKHITNADGNYYKSFREFIGGEFKTSQANYLTQKFRQETIAQIEAIRPVALDLSGNAAVHLAGRLPADKGSQKKVLDKAAEMFAGSRLTTRHIDAALEEALPDKKIPPPDRVPLGNQYSGAEVLVDKREKYTVIVDDDEPEAVEPQFCSTSEDGCYLYVNIGIATYKLDVELVEELLLQAKDIREKKV